MAMKKYLILSILLLNLIFLKTASSLDSKNLEEEEEDLSFLEEEDSAADAHSDSNPYGDHHDFENYDDLEDDSAASDHGYDSYEPPAVDEKDVAVLKEGNFSEFIAKNKHVMVEFYAPWCGHCQALAPEYAAAATELKGENVMLAKVDATEEAELAQKYDVQGYPAVFFFIDGLHKPYNGERNKDAIVSWIKKKTGPALSNITTAEEAERILKDEKKVVLAYLNDLVGDKSEELAAAAALEDDVNFYQTASPDVAKLFHIDSQAKRPALVIIKKEAENINHFGGEFTKSAIAEFVFQNKLPLVTYFTRESASEIFENPIKKQLILFATSKDSDKFLPIFQEAVKAFKGKLISVYVEIDNEDVGKPVSEYFGVSGDAPRVLAYTGNEDGRKFVLEGEITLDNVKSFGEKFLEDNLKPFYKSDPIPETNDGDVKVVVGNNFDEIVLDESKDVLLEIYAPWCGHCQSLEPIYNKLGKHLRGIDSLVIAKMDGTTNEHPRAKSDGFPTLLFFPAGNKSFDPITVDTDRTVVAFYKFLKKHASIPFKIQKPASTQKPTESDASSSPESTIDDVKDEL
ncbi:PREDICTED: protein disulfide isomerase-like 1-3 [Nicotiana attenuata]|uniref:Protein disulfide-isomerase n=1 Tax=Nicotiana attenuata TaxID=49451 RepID=A0A1J6J7Z6_NICAT|nr:PREDICTED: protein disulfide isomerase-like 1-3 [Nicotiana attenuata]OIT03305.1 protein disulfide isomerase-like 1-3 [Nicotiana attenuata]